MFVGLGSDIVVDRMSTLLRAWSHGLDALQALFGFRCRWDVTCCSSLDRMESGTMSVFSEEIVCNLCLQYPVQCLLDPLWIGTRELSVSMNSCLAAGYMFYRKGVGQYRKAGIRELLLVRVIAQV